MKSSSTSLETSSTISTSTGASSAQHRLRLHLHLHVAGASASFPPPPPPPPPPPLAPPPAPPPPPPPRPPRRRRRRRRRLRRVDGDGDLVPSEEGHVCGGLWSTLYLPAAPSADATPSRSSAASSFSSWRAHSPSVAYPAKEVHTARVRASACTTATPLPSAGGGAEPASSYGLGTKKPIRRLPGVRPVGMDGCAVRELRAGRKCANRIARGAHRRRPRPARRRQRPASSSPSSPRGRCRRTGSSSAR